MPLSVAIVEDDDRVRESLAILCDGTAGSRCVGAWRSGEAALVELPGKGPDVVLMDINLPGMSGIECVRRLRGLLPDVHVLMLTVYEDSDAIFESLKAGAHGYLTKEASPGDIMDAVLDVHRGGSPMSPNIARKVIQSFHPPATPAATSGTDELTRREREILDGLARGFLYKEIAGQFGISIETVRTHIRNIYEKLEVHTRTEALLKVYPGFGPGKG